MHKFILASIATDSRLGMLALIGTPPIFASCSTQTVLAALAFTAGIAMLVRAAPPAMLFTLFNACPMHGLNLEGDVHDPKAGAL